MKKSFSYKSPRGKIIEYYLSIPQNSNDNQDARVILALPPGDQSKEAASVYDPWLSEITSSGWAVCTPTAPTGKLFFRGAETYIPGLMDEVTTFLRLPKVGFHIFGVSNGGVSAFRIATLNPERFKSLTVFPGWPKPADVARLDNLLHMPVSFIVGEDDIRWKSKSTHFHNKINNNGGDSVLEIVQNEGHMAFRNFPVKSLLRIIGR